MTKYNHIILASKSPRRQALFHDLNIPFQVITMDTEENYNNQLSPQDAIMSIAMQKAKAVLSHHSSDLVIGCDTMVLIDQIALGKPKDVIDAKRMLHMLSGRTHTVISGVAILTKHKSFIFYEETKVTFYEADEQLINWYINSKEPFDKAGAYGIQEKGKLFVKAICGDYYNVMGLPVARLRRELIKFDT